MSQIIAQQNSWRNVDSPNIFYKFITKKIKFSTKSRAFYWRERKNILWNMDSSSIFIGVQIIGWINQCIGLSFWWIYSFIGDDVRLLPILSLLWVALFSYFDFSRETRNLEWFLTINEKKKTRKKVSLQNCIYLLKQFCWKFQFLAGKISGQELFFIVCQIFGSF